MVGDAYRAYTQDFLSEHYYRVFLSGFPFYVPTSNIPVDQHLDHNVQSVSSPHVRPYFRAYLLGIGGMYQELPGHPHSQKC